MCRDSVRLTALIAAHEKASATYASASHYKAGSAYGVELRTLAAAHRAVAARLAARLRSPGRQPASPSRDLLDIEALAGDPRRGIEEVLRGENRLIEDLSATCRADDVAPETRELLRKALFHVRAHARRVEAFRARL